MCQVIRKERNIDQNAISQPCTHKAGNGVCLNMRVPKMTAWCRVQCQLLYTETVRKACWIWMVLQLLLLLRSQCSIEHEKYTNIHCQLLENKLLTIQMEITFHPWKGLLKKHPKRSLGRTWCIALYIDWIRQKFFALLESLIPNPKGCIMNDMT